MLAILLLILPILDFWESLFKPLYVCKREHDYVCRRGHYYICRRGQVITPLRNRFAGTRFPSGTTFSAGGLQPNRSSSQHPSYIPQSGISGLQGDSQSSADSGITSINVNPSQSRGSDHQRGASQLCTCSLIRLRYCSVYWPTCRSPQSRDLRPSRMQRPTDSPQPGPSGMQQPASSKDLQLSNACSNPRVGSSNFTGNSLGSRYSLFHYLKKIRFFHDCLMNRYFFDLSTVRNGLLLGMQIWIQEQGCKSIFFTLYLV